MRNLYRKFVKNDGDFKVFSSAILLFLLATAVTVATVVRLCTGTAKPGEFIHFVVATGLYGISAISLVLLYNDKHKEEERENLRRLPRQRPDSRPRDPTESSDSESDS